MREIILLLLTLLAFSTLLTYRIGVTVLRSVPSPELRIAVGSKDLREFQHGQRDIGNIADDGRNTTDGGRNTADDGQNTVGDGWNTADDGRNTADDGRGIENTSDGGQIKADRGRSIGDKGNISKQKRLLVKQSSRIYHRLKKVGKLYVLYNVLSM